MMRYPTTIRRSARRKAYTLVEVLITVTIMGMSAAVVVPSMRNGGTLGVQAGARIIVSDLLYAQNEAMAQNATRRVIFTPDDNRYRVQRYDQTEAKWLDDFNPVLGGNSTNNYTIDFDEDSRFKGIEIVSANFGSDAWVEFDDMGNPSSGGTVVIRFNDLSYEIKVAPFTGRVTVKLVE